MRNGVVLVKGIIADDDDDGGGGGGEVINGVFLRWNDFVLVEIGREIRRNILGVSNLELIFQKFKKQIWDDGIEYR